MITYGYWLLVIVLMAAAFWLLGVRNQQWIIALATAATILAIGAGAYYFHYQQIFVKNWGGVMAIKTPKGHYHLGTTWKDENLWVETYNPADNTCRFNEYSKGDLLQGEVIIRNCNPLLAQPVTPAPN